MTPLRLKDLGRWYSGGTPPRDRPEYWDGDVPWISAKDIDSTRLRPASTFITVDAARKHSRVVPAGSLLLIVRGMALAHGLPVVQTGMPVAFNQDLRALVCAPGIVPRFAYYSLIGHRWRLNAHVDQAAHGTARVIDSIYDERIEVPDQSGQQRVVDFLDRECARIDGALAEIAAQRRAVDEFAGVAFGGLVAGMPQAPLRRFIRSLSDGPFGSSLASAHYVDSEETRVIRLGNVGCARFVDDDRAYVADRYAATVLREHLVAADDLIIAGLGDTNQPLGRACVVPDEILPAVHKADCYRAQIDAGKCMAQYLALALTYGPARQAAELLSRGATRSRLNTSIARDLPIPVVAFNEQRIIVDACDVTTFRSSRAVRELSKLADLLVQYRDALITEAVIGELDVTRLSDVQLDESLDAVRQGEQPEVLAS